MRYIVNADDFGRNSRANQRINECFQNNKISSTTVMANMPGFDEAIELAKKNHYENYIGIHIVIDEGRPLTDAMKKCKKFCNSDGSYLNTIPRHQYLSRKERDVLYDEILAQIDRVIEKGIRPTHIDSHHHRHMDFMIAIATRKAMYARNITCVRRHKMAKDYIKRFYGFLVEKYYTMNGLIITTDSFVSLYDSSIEKNKKKETVEVMCHPEIDDDYSILNSGSIDNINMITYYEYIEGKE